MINGEDLLAHARMLGRTGDDEGRSFEMRFCKSCALALVLVLAVFAAGAQQAPTLAGRWEGVLTPDVRSGSRELGPRREGVRLATVMVINGTPGAYTGTFTSVTQNNFRTELGKVELDGAAVYISVPGWGGRYEGKLSDDGSKMEGRWIQNGLRTPFVLTRVAAE